MHCGQTILSNGRLPTSAHFKMDAVEITREQIEPFDKNAVLYVGCIDAAVKFDEVPLDLPFLSYGMFLGHVNFPDEIWRNRRMALFPKTEETKAKFENVGSPAVIDVTASSIVKVMFKFKTICFH